MSKDIYRQEQAVSMLRVQGIISIVFGALGAFISLVVLAILFFIPTNGYPQDQAIGFMFIFFGILIFAIIPHAYMIVSGLALTRNPNPQVARTLTIVNLVIGIIWNYVLLIFAIISLTQLLPYNEAYERSHKK